MPKSNIIEKLSSYLFWDVSRSLINLDNDKKWLIQRVLDYGLLKDWKLIYDYYGIEVISKEVINFKTLDPKSLTFISILSQVPISKFKCYTSKQSTPKHWNF